MTAVESRYFLRINGHPPHPIASSPLLQPRTELGCHSTMGPFSPIRSNCFLAAAARTVLSGSSRRRRWRIRGSRLSSPLPLHRLRGRCLRAAEANWSFDQSRKNRSCAANKVSCLHCRNIAITLTQPGRFLNEHNRLLTTLSRSSAKCRVKITWPELRKQLQVIS
jgi:hypothetical protein